MNRFLKLFPDHETIIGLAPMAGFTTPAFRAIAARLGASYTVTELVSARGIRYDSGLQRCGKFLSPPCEDGLLDGPVPGNAGCGGDPDVTRPWGIQLFGMDPDDFFNAIETVFEKSLYRTAAFVDINMGCPVPKVVKEGAGAALMRDPMLCGRIVEASRKAAERFGLHVTVKIRSGFSPEARNAPAVARAAEAAGASAVTVHARTADRFYSGKADWHEIARVKDAVSIPVIGNGDLMTAADVERMRTETGCDGFAVGRGARGNPFVFSAMRRTPLSDDSELWFQVMTEQLDRTIRLLGEETAVREMRASFAFYLSGFADAASFRRRVMEPVSRDGVLAVLSEAARARGKGRIPPPLT